jgi:hypothetical protein
MVAQQSYNTMETTSDEVSSDGEVTSSFPVLMRTRLAS